MNLLILWKLWFVNDLIMLLYYHKFFLVIKQWKKPEVHLGKIRERVTKSSETFFFCALVQFMVTFFVVYKTDSSWLKLPKSFFLHVAWLMAVVSLFIYEKHNKIVISTHLPCSHTSLWPHLYYQPRTKQKVTVWLIINARDKWALHDQGGY